MSEIDAYILIGGRSRRAGSDKALVDLGGRTLAQRSYETVSEALPDSPVTFVAANEAQFAIEAIIAGGSFIFDLIPDRGPLGGLHAALSYTQKPWIFVTACDYPFVSAELIRLLSSRISNDFGAVIPEQADGMLHPLCAFYKTEAAQALVQQIIDRPRVPPPMHKIVEHIDPLIVPFDDIAGLPGTDRVFFNVNRTSDLDLAREIERKLSRKMEIK